MIRMSKILIREPEEKQFIWHVGIDWRITLIVVLIKQVIRRGLGSSGSG